MLQTLISGWSTGTSVTDKVPKLTLFKNPFQSGLQIFELLSRDDTDDDPPSLWSVVTESLGDGLTLSLSDDATLDLGDEEGSLWSVSGSFETEIAEDTDSDTDTAANGGDAANAGPTAVSAGEVSNQWWFWMMLLLSVVIIAVTVIWKCSCKRTEKVDIVTVDAMEMTSKTMSLSGDAGSHRGLPQLPPESPFDVTEVSPHSEVCDF